MKSFPLNIHLSRLLSRTCKLLIFAFSFATCYPTVAGSDSDIISPTPSRRPSIIPESSSYSSFSNIPSINISSTNINNSTNSIPLSSSLSPCTSPISISPLGTSPETTNPLNPYDPPTSSENGTERKKSKGKKMKIGGKYFKKKKSSSGSTYNADGDTSELSQSEDELSDGMNFLLLYLLPFCPPPSPPLFVLNLIFAILASEVEGVGTPYNVAHHLHVEYHADLGFTV